MDSSAGKGLVARAVNELAQGIAEDQSGCEFQVPSYCPCSRSACATLHCAPVLEGMLHARTHACMRRSWQSHDAQLSGCSSVHCTSQSYTHLQVHLCVVEIYCERIRDLLACSPGAGSGSGDTLVVQQDRERGIIIAGATEACSMPVLPSL